MRTWNTVLLSACICFVAYGCAAPTASEDEVGAEVQANAQALSKGKLLALGDSVAFGYNPLGDFTEKNTFVGYPELLKSEYSIKNASCPGETSGSLLSPTAPDYGCRAYRAAYPLHVNYGDNETQLDYALSRIEGRDANAAPDLITLNVSGNDIFLLEASCADDPSGSTACFLAGLPDLIGSVAQNVGTIFDRIRNEGGYEGRLVFMTLYSLDYNDPVSVAVLTALNGPVSAVARSYGAEIADGYGAFLLASGPGKDPCAAGLLIPLPSGGCDVHPTPEGAEVLAQSVRDAQ